MQNSRARQPLWDHVSREKKSSQNGLQTAFMGENAAKALLNFQPPGDNSTPCSRAAPRFPALIRLAMVWSRPEPVLISERPRLAAVSHKRRFYRTFRVNLASRRSRLARCFPNRRRRRNGFRFPPAPFPPPSHRKRRFCRKLALQFRLPCSPPPRTLGFRTAATRSKASDSTPHSTQTPFPALHPEICRLPRQFSSATANIAEPSETALVCSGLLTLLQVA